VNTNSLIKLLIVMKKLLMNHSVGKIKANFHQLKTKEVVDHVGLSQLLEP
jgi:hypothetical protein